MKLINFQNTKKLIIYFNLIILTLALIILFLDLKVFYVSHASSGMIPIIVYETYSSTETSFLYVLIALIIISSFIFLINRLEKWKSLRILIISILNLITIIIFLLMIINIHFLIISPTANPPTRIIEIFPGFILIIILYIAFFANSILMIQQQRYLSKYVLILSSLIGALLISHAIHESGHALFVLLCGGQVTEFYPFPFFMDGILRTGYVSYQNVPLPLVPLVTLGGEILQWITILIILFILFRVRTPKILTVFLTFLLTISWLDFPLYTINNALGIPHWFVIGCSHGDIMGFIVQTGVPLWLMLLLASLQLFLGILILYFKSLKSYVSIRIQVKEKTPLIS
ncbi:MAG: hypothetical protein ACFFB9_09050 [Promethearchaeota archaeon]